MAIIKRFKAWLHAICPQATEEKEPVGHPGDQALLVDEDGHEALVALIDQHQDGRYWVVPLPDPWSALPNQEPERHDSFCSPWDNPGPAEVGEPFDVEESALTALSTVDLDEEDAYCWVHGEDGHTASYGCMRDVGMID